jgi:hypothetical protein
MKYLERPLRLAQFQQPFLQAQFQQPFLQAQFLKRYSVFFSFDLSSTDI